MRYVLQMTKPRWSVDHWCWCGRWVFFVWCLSWTNLPHDAQIILDVGSIFVIRFYLSLAKHSDP